MHPCNTSQRSESQKIVKNQITQGAKTGPVTALISAVRPRSRRVVSTTSKAERSDKSRRKAAAFIR